MKFFRFFQPVIPLLPITQSCSIQGGYEGQFELSQLSSFNAPADLADVASMNLGYIKKHRPDVISFLSRVTMLEYKQALYKTVETVTQDETVRQWWSNYLLNMSEAAPKLPPGSVKELYVCPGTTAAGARRVVNVVDPHVDDNLSELGVDTAFLNGHVEYRVIENRVIDDLTYAGHKPGERDREMRQEISAESNRRSRWNRHEAPPPALIKGAFVWISVKAKPSEDLDQCAFDLAKVVDGTEPDGEWSDLVLIYWCYRSQAKKGYDTSSYFLGKDKNGKNISQKVERRSIEVDDVDVAGKPSALTISAIGINAICAAGLGFFHGRSSKKLEYKPPLDGVEISDALSSRCNDDDINRTGDDNISDATPVLDVYTSLWLQRLKNWPCEDEPDPTYVFAQMPPQTRDHFVHQTLKSYTRLTRRLDIRQRCTTLGTRPSADNQQLFVDTMRLYLSYNSGASWLPIVLLHTGDERSELENTEVVCDGLTPNSIALLSKPEDNHLLSDAPFLPWGAVLDHQHVVGLCGMFQEMGSELNPWYFVRLKLEWTTLKKRKQSRDGRSYTQQKELKGEVTLTSSAAAAAEQKSKGAFSSPDQLGKIIARGAQATLGGTWTVGAGEEWPSSDDGSGNVDVDVRLREWEFLRAAFSMMEKCCSPDKKKEDKKRKIEGDIEMTLLALQQWYRKACFDLALLGGGDGRKLKKKHKQ